MSEWVDGWMTYSLEGVVGKVGRYLGKIGVPEGKMFIFFSQCLHQSLFYSTRERKKENGPEFSFYYPRDGSRKKYLIPRYLVSPYFFPFRFQALYPSLYRASNGRRGRKEEGVRIERIFFSLFFFRPSFPLRCDQTGYNRREENMEGREGK